MIIDIVIKLLINPLQLANVAISHEFGQLRSHREGVGEHVFKRCKNLFSLSQVVGI